MPLPANEKNGFKLGHYPPNPFLDTAASVRHFSHLLTI